MMTSAKMDRKLRELLTSKGANKQLSVPQLVEKVTCRREALLTITGAVSAHTGKYTGRSPKDRYIVQEPSSQNQIDWGSVNRPISPTIFNRLYEKITTYLLEKEEIFVFKGFAGADHDSRLPIQVINEYAWHNLFVHQLFIRPTDEELAGHEAEFTIISAPTFKADPKIDGTDSETFIIIHMEKGIVLIGGTEYAGEMKKSIFSVMNYLLPQQNILPMHCSANVGDDDDVALFFGLSGTGKTTLSADPKRKLIGDDEHGWSKEGVFNIEGGCYAKCIQLSAENEPEIFNAIQFGAVLENVIVHPHTRIANYDDPSLTENTRVAYPIQHIENRIIPSTAGHPNTIIFLTADAFGVLPPISKLTKEQAMYHFLSGFTSKLAGTERGITSPEATFSTCFGAPFLPLPATVYAKMLGHKIDEHDAQVFLVNTGWTGGTYGVGQRIALKHTRGMIQAAITGTLNQRQTVKDPFFGLEIPIAIKGIPSDILNPRNTWDDKEAYDQKAIDLIHLFKENFKKFKSVAEEIRLKGGPLP